MFGSGLHSRHGIYADGGLGPKHWIGFSLHLSFLNELLLPFILQSTADDVVYAGVVMEEKDYDAIIDESAAPRKPRAVHQCSECNKIFVSFKGDC